MERVTERGLVCCNVRICAGVTGWREGGKWKRLQKGVFICCNVVMCGVVTGWREGGKCKVLQKGVLCVVMC